ncbi:hypothetical protein F4861DRAFT_544505 [Xylaria intraflava]|nr:hypothetical protein F4861DRAFT_544505 [Xylaria intraflava]
MSDLPPVMSVADIRDTYEPFLARGWHHLRRRYVDDDGAEVRVPGAEPCTRCVVSTHKDLRLRCLCEPGKLTRCKECSHAHLACVAVPASLTGVSMAVSRFSVRVARFVRGVLRDNPGHDIDEDDLAAAGRRLLVLARCETYLGRCIKEEEKTLAGLRSIAQTAQAIRRAEVKVRLLDTEVAHVSVHADEATSADDSVEAEDEGEEESEDEEEEGEESEDSSSDTSSQGSSSAGDRGGSEEASSAEESGGESASEAEDEEMVDVDDEEESSGEEEEEEDEEESSSSEEDDEESEWHGFDDDDFVLSQPTE